MCSAKRRGKEGIPPSIGHIQTIANERTGLRPPNRHRSPKLGCHLPPRGEIRRRGKVPQRGTGYSRKATRTSPILLHRRPRQSLPGLRRFAGRYGRKRPGRRDVRESGNAIYKSRRKKRTSKSIHRRFDLCMGRYSPRLRGIRPGRIPVQTSIEHIQ